MYDTLYIYTNPRYQLAVIYIFIYPRKLGIQFHCYHNYHFYLVCNLYKTLIISKNQIQICTSYIVLFIYLNVCDKQIVHCTFHTLIIHYITVS